MPEVNPVSKSNAEHTFCPKTCLSLVLQHLYKVDFVWTLA